MDLESSRKLIEVSKKSNILSPTAGIHPHRAPNSTRDEITGILKLFEQDEVIAAAEIGVDLHFMDKETKEDQLEVFRSVMEGALRQNLPIILHCPRGEPLCHKEIERAGVDKAVFHWYTGPHEILRKILEKEGYYISVTPAVTYSGKLQKIVDIADLGSILVESDGPTEYRNIGRGRPSQIPQVLEKIAEVKEVDRTEVEKETTRNAEHFFGF